MRREGEGFGRTWRARIRDLGAARRSLHPDQASHPRPKGESYILETFIISKCISLQLRLVVYLLTDHLPRPSNAPARPQLNRGRLLSLATYDFTSLAKESRANRLRIAIPHQLKSLGLTLLVSLSLLHPPPKEQRLALLATAFISTAFIGSHSTKLSCRTATTRLTPSPPSHRPPRRAAPPPNLHPQARIRRLFLTTLEARVAQGGQPTPPRLPRRKTPPFGLSTRRSARARRSAQRRRQRREPES